MRILQKKISNWFTLPFIGLVKIYQCAISPIFPPSCRFLPTCSSYSVEALKKYGLFKGFWLTVQRIGKCRPGRFGGYDPVP